MNVQQRSAGLAMVAGPHRELDLPPRFRLVDDLALLSSGGPVVVVGGPHLLSITGASAQWLIARLLPLLTEATDAREVCERVPDVPAASVLDVLYLLHWNGMLEEAVGDQHRDESQARYFGRYLGVTGRHSHGGTAHERVQAATIRPIGPATTVAVMRRALARAGLAEAAAESTGTLGVGVVGPGTALVSGPILHVDLPGMTVGPLTLPGDTPCAQCARLQLPAARVGRAAAHWRDALAAIAVREIVAYVSGVFRPPTLQGVIRFDSASRAFTPVPVHRLARCPACGDPGLPANVVLGDSHEEELALTVHFSQAVRSWMPAERAGFRIHVSPEIERLTRASFAVAPRVMPVAPAGRLPPVLARAATEVGQDPSRPGSWRRIATAGNLGSPRAQVRLVGEGSRGPRRFATLAPDGQVGTVSDSVAGAEDFDLLVTSDYSRVASKYGGRASAYTLLDAGVCLARLSRCLGMLGQPHALVPSVGIGADPVGEEDERLLCTAAITLAPHLSRRGHSVVPRTDGRESLAVPMMDAGWLLASRMAGLHAPAFAAPPDSGWTWERYQRAADRRRSGGIARASHLDDLPLRAVLDSLDWAAPWACAGPRVGALVVTRDVAGIHDGVHVRDAATGWLSEWARADLEELLEDLVLQAEHLQGHAVVLLFTDLVEWSRATGLLGYKLALLAAGWLLDGLYLGAAELGLTCSATGGFAPRETRQRLEQVTGRRVGDLLIGFVIGAQGSGPHP